MRVGITGSRTLSTPQRRQAHLILRGILSVYGPADELHHGDANGIDKIAAEEALRLGIEVIRHLPKNQRWKGGYRERNMEIVDSSDIVIAVHSHLSTTGGTVWTYNYAVRQGKNTEWIELDRR